MVHPGSVAAHGPRRHQHAVGCHRPRDSPPGA
jgi:hypothetical protein